jgi:hypothetical protein
LPTLGATLDYGQEKVGTNTISEPCLNSVCFWVLGLGCALHCPARLISLLLREDLARLSHSLIELRRIGHSLVSFTDEDKEKRLAA